METIFDHNPTEKELEALGNENLSKEELLEMWNKGDNESHDSRLMDIAKLFSMRGNDKKAEEYVSKIIDDEIRFSAEFMLMELA